MKKILLYLSILTIGFVTGCKKTDDPILDDPDTRLTAELQKDMNALVSSANGWRADIYPAGGKGFSYYFKFTADGKVTMLSDFNATTAVTPKESTFRLKALQRPTLIFDTYSYIHLPADPNASVSGGSTGTGLKSDFEFAIIEIKDNTITLEGTINKSKMVLTKLSAADESAYLASGLKSSMDINALYLSTNKFPFIQFSDGVKIAVTIDPISKIITLNWVEQGDVSKIISTNFSFTLTGFTLKTPLVYGTNSFKDIFWDPAVKVYYFTNGTTRVNFQNSTTPVIPLKILFGAGKDYSQIEYNPATVTTGLSADFNTKYNTAKAGLAAVGNAGRILDYVRVIFPIDAPTTMVLRFYYRNTAGTAFQANMTYTFVKNANEEYDFTYLSSDGNAGVVGGGLVVLKDYFDLNNFKVDWVANPGSGAPYGGLYVVNNPASFFYGTLIK